MVLNLENETTATTNDDDNDDDDDDDDDDDSHRHHHQKGHSNSALNRVMRAKNDKRHSKNGFEKKKTYD